MGAHLVEVDGVLTFQSDKYPTCPAGKVPLSVKDPAAQDLLWVYAQRRRAVDPEFSDDLEQALLNAGYERPRVDTLAGWHGFDWRGAARMDPEDRERLLEVTAGFRKSDLGHKVFLLSGSALQEGGHATFNASGDTLFLRAITRDGQQYLYDCVIRRMWCAP